MNALSQDRAMRAVVRERDALMQQCDGLATAHELMNRELESLRPFITRMVSEYRAQLVSYVEVCQGNVEYFAENPNYPSAYSKPGQSGEDYYRAELIEATRRLALSDTELLPFISVADQKPYQIQSFGPDVD